MFKRLLWLGVGIGIGVVVVRTVTRTARKFTPTGLAGQAQESIGYAAGSVRSFFDDLRDGMNEREDDIRLHFAEGEALDAPDQPWARGVGSRFHQFKQQIMEGE